MFIGKRILSVFIVGVSFLIIVSGVSAEEKFPTQPIRLIVPYSPGGGTDTAARIIADGVAKYIDQPIVVENRPGGSGTVGTILAASEKPDGYTLLFGIQATMAMNPSLFKAATYSPTKDFDGVALISESPYVITVPKQTGIKNYEEFAPAAKERMTMANGGSAALLAARLLAKSSGFKFANIPYSGTGSAISDVLSGRVDALISSPVSVLPHIKSGALIPILVTSLERFNHLPDTPTANELGFNDFKVVGWYGIVAPKGVPQDRLAILNAAFIKAAGEPQTNQRLVDAGLVPSSIGMSVEQTTAFIAKENEFWTDEIKDAGLKPK